VEGVDPLIFLCLSVVVWMITKSNTSYNPKL
jgi:hypothetical protein